MLSIVFTFQPVVTLHMVTVFMSQLREILFKGYRKWWGAPAGSRLHLDPTDRANEILYYCVSKTFVAACPSSIYLITDAKLIFVRMLDCCS